MAYEANRDDDAEKARSDQNNANNIRNAADVAIATKNPYAMAAGGAIKAADKITGGKSTEALGKAMTKANQISPGGKQIQNASNRLNESGASDKIGNAAAMKNGVQGNAGGNTPNQVVNNKTAGGEQGGSLPSSASGNQPNQMPSANANSADPEGNSRGMPPVGGGDDNSSNDSDDTSSRKGNGLLQFVGGSVVKAVTIAALPFLVILLVLFVAAGSVSGIFGDYEDAFGISQTTREDTGDIEFNASSQEQQDFYDRVNDIKLKYQAQGKTVDALKVVAVYHVLNKNGAGLDYEDMTDSAIEEIVNSMFDGNTYSDETFKNNLISSIIPKYLPKTSTKERESIADDILDYVDSYRDLIGSSGSGSSYGSYTCTSSGSCSYDIKGFYISGKGNVSKNIQLSNLYVRLMQCGTGDGHNYGGTFGQPLAGEELVPFEKYVLGVAYAEVGDGAPAEAFKAQAVAARSFALARHVDMGGWRTLQQESDGKWILQLAACTQDQVYCDPDQGCSSNDGQWGQVHSGLKYDSGYSKPALSSDSPLRGYASATEGEVLVNSQGYIVYTGFGREEQKTFTSLAKKGLNYKQILLQLYNQGSRKYGASNITKSSCGSSSNCSTSSGEYTQWKQYEGPWVSTPMGNSGKNIRQIGCLVTSVAIQMARSGVPISISNFNPGTFVEFLNNNGGFVSGGNFVWGAATKAAPTFQYQGQISVSGMSRSQKLAKIKELVSMNGVYVIAEVKGNTGQHWVAIDSVNGNTVNMMDPGSGSTDMWGQYNWANTSTLAYYRVG